jgi:hypothetical protein
MALDTYLPAKVANRVQETSHSTGTGNFVLEGAVPNYLSFNSKFLNGDKIYYAIITADASEFECGIGTFVSPSTLQRNVSVNESSNSNNLVNFSSGIKVVAVSPTAGWGNDIVSASVAASMAITIALS